LREHAEPFAHKSKPALHEKLQVPPEQMRVPLPLGSAGHIVHEVPHLSGSLSAAHEAKLQLWVPAGQAQLPPEQVAPGCVQVEPEQHSCDTCPQALQSEPG